MDLVGTVRSDTLGLNTAFRGDNPFNAVRLRVFLRRWVTDRVGIFGELLYDIDAAARVNGAYVVVNEVAGRSWLNTRLGLAPSPVGSFGLRSTYFNVNPLIGMPLVWTYRTNLKGGGTSTPTGLAGQTREHGGGVPLLYESCWNVQWELMGELGRFEYSIAVTPGSISNPMSSRLVPGSSVMGRVGVAPIDGLRFGVSAAWGPYLSKPVPDSTGALPYADDPSDFTQTVLGMDLEYQRGAWIFSSEAYALRYETPLVDESLGALGAYAEARYDFLTGWYVAGRLDRLFFDEVTTDPLTGAEAPWDRDTHRTEVALGYRLTREVLLKLDWQRTTVPDSDFEQNLWAAQISSVF